ncbi:hypothetical protein [Sinomicrobium weinanense]|uniref:Lipoprotein n=1 Tax=Sinomicrobium weinanense TaxID=2842200 RepID=A0A926Q3C1_9FLAO|nr:hypothetical protein [Sinomicrobium weinanense]MBC9795851.1 hypothetical protein [Sinomicrobium weinanense]MBU3125371.1 hypothetical protein [Sinomicrobium weinanense]
MTKGSLWYCSVLCLLVACSSRTFDTEESLLAYIREERNGYMHHKRVNGVGFSLLYKPTDLLVNQELYDKADQKTIDSLRQKYNKYMYFILSMSKNNQELLNNVAGDRGRFGGMINELAFEMDQKVHLYTPKKDTLPMADFIYPRMYGMSRSTDIMLVYSREEKYLRDEYINVTVEDLGFYTGEVRFKIPTKGIQNEPELTFNVVAFKSVKK